jgi:endogenous inhibitor of DNA gyrase (YacG/DUF329 family)
MKCPICKNDVEPGSVYAPFCSDRCRIIDLGNWTTEKYRISRPLKPSEEENEKREEEPSDREG